MSRKFTFEDFLKQMQMLKKMGPLSGLLGMIPGMGKQLQGAQIDDRMLGRVEAMVTSMTARERQNPKLLQNQSRVRGSPAAPGRPRRKSRSL